MTTPRWLNDDEMLLWRSFIALSVGALQDINTDFKNDSDLSRDDYEVLVNLSESADRCLSMSELSERLMNSRSRASQRIDRMEARGLVAREQCPDDKRSTLARITPAGLETIKSAAPQHVGSVRRHLIDHLSPAEVVQLGGLLEKLVKERS